MDSKSKRALEIHAKMTSLVSELKSIGYEFVNLECFNITQTTVRKVKNNGKITSNI
jgi:hypothetical protein